MARFLGRRYARSAKTISRTEKIVGAAILSLLMAIIGLFAITTLTGKQPLLDVSEVAYGYVGEVRNAANEPMYNPGAPATKPGVARTDVRLPALDLAGWEPLPTVSNFGPDTLHLKINGRADFFLKLNVVGLTFGRYSHTTDPDSALDVYWFDMDEADQAALAYRAEAPPNLTAVAVGSEGYEVGGAVFFRAGSAYIQIIPSAMRSDLTAASLHLAQLLVSTVDQDNSA